MKRSWLLMLVVGLLGCVHTYELQPQGAGGAPIALARNSAIYVGVPEPGRYEHEHYPKSGEQTAQAVASVLSAYSNGVKTADGTRSRDDNLAGARAAGARYLVQPTIQHWEERATEWSGKSDRITIHLELVEVASGETLDRYRFSGKSRWFTFGGDHPQDLLHEPLTGYAHRLFAN